MSSSSPRDKKLLDILKNMETHRVEYPEELLSARRSAFIEQLEQYSAAEVGAQSPSQDQKVIRLLQRLKNVPERYPPRLLAARRAAFVSRIVWMNWVSLWGAIWTAVQERISLPAGFPSISLRRLSSAPLMIAGLAIAAFMGILLYTSNNPVAVTNLFRAQHGIVKSARIITANTRVAEVICKPGYVPPLCLAGVFNREEDLTYQGNGTARPAVAKDTIPGHGTVHQAAYVNDGLYGPGASWISNSPNSWIKIDLGKETPINMVRFGRDRLGEFNDRDPGQFVIALAMTDNVYADGNNSNDEFEYTEVYNSEQAGFKGKISGPETVIVQFKPRTARYIKIIFQNKGTAIDEVEAFMIRVPELGRDEQRPRKEKQSQNPVIPPVINTSVPANTATAEPVDTPTPLPTYTQIPTDTSTPVPTSTPLPTDTPVPADTPTPVPTDTPLPTDTPPAPTSTPYPTDTMPAPTEMFLTPSTAVPAIGTPGAEDLPRGSVISSP